MTLDEASSQYFLKNNEENLKEVINAGEKLVHYFIHLYGFDFPKEDLFHVGSEGIMKALARFDPTCGVSFTTYAGCLIIGEIRHYVRKEVHYYYPQIIMRMQDKVDDTIKSELLKTGNLLQCEEISKLMNIKKEGLREVMRSGLLPIEEINMHKIASMRQESFRLPIEDRILLEQSLKKLTDLQRKVIKMIFYKDMTQEQTAKKLGINQRKVSRIKNKSIEILHQNMSE
jgi:RNA polymerase sigma-B factor